MLNAEQKGGLGVGSIAALNKALLFKWNWRFLMADEEHVWVKVLKAFHGSHVGLSTSNVVTGGGVWKTIVDTINRLRMDEILQSSALSKVVKGGSNTRFWNDVWCGDMAFQVRFHRRFLLSTNTNGMVRDFWEDTGWNLQWWLPIRGGAQQAMLQELMAILVGFGCSEGRDTWRWGLHPSGVFTVSLFVVILML